MMAKKHKDGEKSSDEDLVKVNENSDKNGTENKVADDNMSNVSHVTYDNALDGGWGWVVVFAVFMGNFLIDGCIGCFGLFYPVLQQAFESSPAMTSMAGSLIAGVYLFSSPFIGGLINRFGCRKVCFVGGCVAAAGFTTSIASRGIVTFMITYGLVGGVGLGMNSLTGHIMVNTYFSEKRGIANGIVSSGAGCGVFILVPFTQFLLDAYDWKGAMLIMSGIVLQFCVCATLMRPLHLNRPRSKHFEGDSSTSDSIDLSSDGVASQVEQPLLKNRTICLLKAEEYSSLRKVGGDFESIPKKQRCISEKYPSNFSLNLSEAGNHVHMSNISSLPDLSKDISKSVNVRRKGSARNTGNHHNHSHPQSHLRTHLSPLLRKDIFYSGSLHHLKEYNNTEGVSSCIQSVASMQPEKSSLSGTSVDGTCGKQRLFDVSIFKHNVYIPMLLGAVCIQMAQFIPSTFIPKHCYTLGFEKEQVSIVFILYGVSNIFGRLSAGCLANVRCINPLWLCNFGTLMCGVCCLLYPLCTALIPMCIYMICFGFFIGYFPPLQVLIMVDYLGLDKLTSAVGFLQMAKGPAAVIGPPMAGVVYEWTQNYAMSMEFAAVLFLLAAGIQSLVPIINRCSKHREPGNTKEDITIIVS